MHLHCVWGTCKSDSRKNEPGVTFIPFPKPWIDKKRAKRWSFLCGRGKDFTVGHITNNTYICSRHFGTDQVLSLRENLTLEPFNARIRGSPKPRETRTSRPNTMAAPRSTASSPTAARSPLAAASSGETRSPSASRLKVVAGTGAHEFSPHKAGVLKPTRLYARQPALQTMEVESSDSSDSEQHIEIEIPSSPVLPEGVDPISPIKRRYLITEMKDKGVMADVKPSRHITALRLENTILKRQLRSASNRSVLKRKLPHPAEDKVEWMKSKPSRFKFFTGEVKTYRERLNQCSRFGEFHYLKYYYYCY